MNAPSLSLKTESSLPARLIFAFPPFVMGKWIYIFRSALFWTAPGSAHSAFWRRYCFPWHCAIRWWYDWATLVGKQASIQGGIPLNLNSEYLTNFVLLVSREFSPCGLIWTAFGTTAHLSILETQLFMKHFCFLSQWNPAALRSTPPAQIILESYTVNQLLYGNGLQPAWTAGSTTTWNTVQYTVYRRAWQGWMQLTSSSSNTPYGVNKSR